MALNPNEVIEIEAVAKDIVDAAIKVHKALGPGLLEYELRRRGRKVLTEVSLPLTYEGQKIDAGYRIDMLVDDLIIIENKTVESLLPIHEAQIMTYLKLGKCKIGFLLNWNVTLMKRGIRRVVMNLPGPTPYPKHFKKGST
jgi:GxxExxY protein